MSNILSGRIGDSTVNTMQLKGEFENKYLQKTSYTISNLGILSQ